MRRTGDSSASDRHRQIVEAITILADKRDVVLTRKKLAKLLYLADLRAVEQRMDPVSGFAWEWAAYGPWSNAIYRAIDAAVASGVVLTSLGAAQFGAPEYRVEAVAAVPDHASESMRRLGTDVIRVLEQVLDEHGHKAPNELGNFTYATRPMVEAQKNGKRGDRLDLHAGSRHDVSLTELAERLEVPDEFWPRDDHPRIRQEPEGPLLQLPRRMFRTA